MGDRRCPPTASQVHQAELATPDLAPEARDEPQAESTLDSAPEAGCEAQALAGPAEEQAPVEWLLVAWPELLETARLRQGTWAVCPFCGRRGRIEQVVSVEEWRRVLRHRRGGRE